MEIISIVDRLKAELGNMIVQLHTRDFQIETLKAEVQRLQAQLPKDKEIQEKGY